MAGRLKVNQVEPPELLVDRAYQELRAAILENRLPPGTPMSVPALAREMGISRSPVREALQRLVHDGLLSYTRHRGAEVARVDLADLRQLYLVREMLEGLAARLATETVGPAGLADLRQILAEHASALREDAGEAAHITLDIRFHAKIRDLADNTHLLRALEPLAGRSHFALHSLWRSPEAPALALSEHELVFAAMIAGDPAAAESAARRHIANLRVRLAHAVPLTDAAAQRPAQELA